MNTNPCQPPEQTWQTSLAALFIAITAIAVALACWVNYPRPPEGEGNIVVTAAVTALVTALLTPFGIRGGLSLGAIAVFVPCLMVEKDPSGLGPFELIFPIQLVAALVPMILTAAIGRRLHAWLSN